MIRPSIHTSVLNPTHGVFRKLDDMSLSIFKCEYPVEHILYWKLLNPGFKRSFENFYLFTKRVIAEV
jgi:hypothetical protein